MRRESLPWVVSGGWMGAVAPLWDCHARAPTYLAYILKRCTVTPHK